MEPTKEILNAKHVLHAAGEAERAARRTTLMAESALKALVAKELRLTYITLGTFWQCPDSPTRHCIYNDEEDPAHDDCIFCHGPEERK